MWRAIIYLVESRLLSNGPEYTRTAQQRSIKAPPTVKESIWNIRTRREPSTNPLFRPSQPKCADKKWHLTNQQNCRKQKRQESRPGQMKSSPLHHCPENFPNLFSEISFVKKNIPLCKARACLRYRKQTLAALTDLRTLPFLFTPCLKYKAPPIRTRGYTLTESI